MKNQHSNHITQTRAAVTEFLSALDKLRALDKQRIALDLGTAIDNGTRIETDPVDVRFGDFQGTNSDIELSDLQAVTGTLGAFEEMLATGHATNLYKVKY
jgi:hypothetical protein